MIFLTLTRNPIHDTFIPYHMSDSVFDLDPLYGDSLRDAVRSEQAKRKPIIPGILYEQTMTMLFADSGVGKSTLMAQLIAQLSTGMPIFGALELERAYTCYYLQFERTHLEITERLKEMEKVIPVDYSKIIVDDRIVGVNLLRPEQAQATIDRIKRKSQKAGWSSTDLVFLDPIYASVAGGLSQDEPATIFTRFSSSLQKELHCSNILGHHTSRQQYSSSGDKVDKEDAYYGSTWIKAHVTGSFFISNWKDGTHWTQKKDNYKCLFDKFALRYDPATYLSYMDGDNALSQKRDRFKLFLNSCHRTQHKFTVKEVVNSLGATDRYVRELIVEPEFRSCLTEHKYTTKPWEYEVSKLL